MEKYSIETFNLALQQKEYSLVLNAVKKVTKEELGFTKEELENSNLPFEIKKGLMEKLEDKNGRVKELFIDNENNNNDNNSSIEIEEEKKLLEKEKFIKKEMNLFIKEEYIDLAFSMIEKRLIKTFSIETGSTKKLLEPIIKKYPDFEFKKKGFDDLKIDQKQKPKKTQEELREEIDKLIGKKDATRILAGKGFF